MTALRHHHKRAGVFGMNNLTNLTSHLLVQHGHSVASRELAAIINQIVFAGKLISREVNKAGLVDVLGATGVINVQQEEVQKLDQLADDTLTDLLRQIPYVRAVGSEEKEEILEFAEHNTTGKYIVFFDPLDGSSNIDVNVSTGTIFSVFRTQFRGQIGSSEDYLTSSKDIIASGYLLYGSSTMLIYSSGYGVHGFTLDPSIGEYLLSHPHIKIPKIAKTYSVNESYSPKWDSGIRRYIDEVKTNNDISGKPKSARYIGSLVADFHRNLLTGGIFLYPADQKNPQGKLRLIFEAIPLAYLATQAGGAASTGTQNILDIKPEKLHQRVPLFIGSKDDVSQVQTLINQS